MRDIITSARLFALGFAQCESILNQLPMEIALKIIVLSSEKPESIMGNKAFFTRPPVYYPDGCSTLPIALYYDHLHFDGLSPLPIELYYDPSHSDGISPLPLSLGNKTQRREECYLGFSLFSMESFFYNYSDLLEALFAHSDPNVQVDQDLNVDEHDEEPFVERDFYFGM
jgi:hypothetical protein